MTHELCVITEVSNDGVLLDELQVLLKGGLIVMFDQLPQRTEAIRPMPRQFGRLSTTRRECLPVRDNRPMSTRTLRCRGCSASTATTPPRAGQCTRPAQQPGGPPFDAADLLPLMWASRVEKAPG